MPPTDALLADLTRHETFVRRVVRSLVHSDSDADDIVQETWIRALGRGIAERTWLARTARNVALDRYRSERSRKGREASLAGDGTAPPADRATIALEDRQRVVAAVLALEEPYRAAVVLRYGEGKSIREVAEALQRPEGTVRAQLSRAHGLLRERLDADFGDTRRWAALAGPAALVRSGGAASAAWPVLLAAGAVAAAVTALVVLGRDGESTSGPALEGRVAAATLSDGTVTLSAVGTPSSDAPTRAEVPQGTEPEAVALPLSERILPRAELLSRGHFDDYEKATFSFPHGLRDDPGLERTCNRWSVLFDNGGGGFDFDMPFRGSVVADLGPIGLQEAADVKPHTRTFEDLYRVPVRPGHTYLVWESWERAEVVSFVRVVAYEPKRRVTFDWYTTDGSGRGQGSVADDREGRPIVEALCAWREALRAKDLLKGTAITLEVRAGSGGGNPNVVDMGGRTSMYVDEVSDAPLDLETPIDGHDPSIAYARGGLIPTGQRFVVTSFSYEGVGGGDNNGHGEAIFSIAGEEVARAKSDQGHISGAWSHDGGADTMPFVIRSGEEASTYVEVANSSWARLVIEGRLEEDPMDGPVPFGAGDTGFLAFPPPVPVPAAPDLEAPRAELRVKNLHGGGNPHSIDLLGRPSMYIQSTETSLEEYGKPLDPQMRSRAFAIGGSVPEGQCFIVTAATLTGSWNAETHESDYARLMLGREEIIDVAGSTGPFRSEWHGTLRIERGEEFRLRLEIADNAEAEVVIEGRFEPVGR